MTNIKTQAEINDEILNSDRFTKNGVSYAAPSFYLLPVIKEFKNSLNGHLVIDGSDPDTITDNETEVQYLAYRRVALTKTFEISEDFSYKIGFVYALDLGKPIIKVFSGVNVHACTNLCIFGADKKQEFLIANNQEGAVLEVQKYITNLTHDIETAKEIIHNMKNTFFQSQEVEKMLGAFMLSFSATKNIAGTQCLLDAAKYLTDKTSMYYFEKQTTAWNIYNALTHDICNKKHILQQPEKVFTLFNEMKKFKNFAAETMPLLLN